MLFHQKLFLLIIFFFFPSYIFFSSTIFFLLWYHYLSRPGSTAFNPSPLWCQKCPSLLGSFSNDPEIILYGQKTNQNIPHHPINFLIIKINKIRHSPFWTWSDYKVHDHFFSHEVKSIRCTLFHRNFLSNFHIRLLYSISEKNSLL